MKYYYQIEADVRNNIGDILQGMVAKALLPPEAEVVNRETLADLDKTAPAFLIANGWYMHSFEKFPPPPNINPLYVSMHIAKSALLCDMKIREHFIQHSPIGCRDKKTLHLFLGWGIPAYYSGCLTTTTTARVPINQSTDSEIILVDNVDHPVPTEIRQKLEQLVGRQLTTVSHDPPETGGTCEEYAANAEAHMNSLLKRYCNASLIITTKIHCALPCLGMGVKVLMIHPHPEEGRLGPLTEFIKIMSYNEILTSSSIIIPTVKQTILNERRNFLQKLCIESAKVGKNALQNSDNPHFISLRMKSKLHAVLFRFGIKTAYKLGIAKQKIRRVYGAGLN